MIAPGYGAGMSDPDQRSLAAVLEWTMAMGADAAVADEAIDWLVPDRPAPGTGFVLQGLEGPERGPAPVVRGDAQSPVGAEPTAPRSPLQASTPVAAPRKFATAPPDVATGSARTAARKAGTLEELRRALEVFDGCSLKATAKNLCFYRGAPTAPLMIIGEAPGREEDHEGRPFVGRAGQLLDRMLAAAGFSEADVHITNIVYWRPPGNRTPTPQEAEVCRPFLERQMELVAPKVLLLLGGAAAKQILRIEDGILRLRGSWRQVEVGGHPVAIMASLHPAYLLRSPASKRQAWRDFLEVRRVLREAGVTPGKSG